MANKRDDCLESCAVQGLDARPRLASPWQARLGTRWNQSSWTRWETAYRCGFVPADTTW